VAGVEQALRETARELLREGKVGTIIGYVRGSTPFRSTPAFIENEEEADRLVFDVTCGSNLARYVRNHGRDGRVAIVAKGCDGRAVVQYLSEGQLKRDDVLIVGVPCTGVLDHGKVSRLVRNRNVTGFREENGKLVFEGDGFEVTADREDVLADSCLRCRYPNPPVHDVFLDEPAEAAPDGLHWQELEKFEQMAAQERWAFFEKEFARCIRCYACRNACPMCYCEECFVDQSDPQWIGKGIDPSDTMLFHLVRALHTAGRCVECGACERACPLGIRLDLLNSKLEREVHDRFGYTPGTDPDETPAMATYDEEDKQEFML